MIETRTNWATENSADRGPSIFLSYAMEDDAFVSKLARRLARVMGAHVMPEPIKAGAIWAKQLQRQIEDADVMVAVLTPAGLSSDWVLQEIGAAWGLKKPIIAVTRDGQTAKLPKPLSGLITARISDIDEEQSQNALIDAVKQTAARRLA